MHKDETRQLREQADRCRRLAATCNDPVSARVLRDMAADYEARARSCQAAPPLPTPPAGE